MWLLTAIGPVHGQIRFTFALEQKREYSVGRDDGCDIRFESRQIRPKEGTVVVDDWNPTQPHTPPTLRWRLEPKKNGSYGSIKTLGLIDMDDAGSTERSEYEVNEVKDSHGCYFEGMVQGVELAEDMWFTTEWRAVGLQYDKINEESDATRDLLRQYCIAWTKIFDIENRPTYVLSPLYKSNADCNYAVCFGIRIVQPSFLEALISRIWACWKKMADYQDSFTLPDEEDDAYQPELDGGLPASRKDVRCWLPNKKRQTLFKGWKVMGLRGKTQSAEKRYLLAMGADYQELDVLTDPVSSSQDFTDRLSSWLSDVDENSGREQALVIWFIPVKQELAKKGIDYTSVWCDQVPGGIGDEFAQGHCHEEWVWVDMLHSPRWSRTPMHLTLTIVIYTFSAPAEESTAPPRPKRVHSTLGQAPVETEAGPSSRPEFIPSTFPDETEARKSPSPERPHIRERNASSGREKTLEPKASSAPTKKPLRRRANKPMLELPDSPPLSGPSTQDEDNSQASQPLFSQPNFVQDSMPQPTQASAFGPQATQTQSVVPDSVSVSQAPGRSSRLKRRAGGTTPSLIQEIADTSINLEKDIKAEERAADIRSLYEQTKSGSFAPSHHVSKRPRLATVDSEESGGSASTRARQDDAMDVDESEESATGIVGRSTRSKRATSTERMPPPAQPSRRRIRSPSAEEDEEEEEVVESRTAGKAPPRWHGTEAEHASPSKSAALKHKSQSQAARSSGGPSKDEAFLQAISKSAKSRKAIDELDREFNQLRIPKPNGATAVVRANEWESNVPDYALLNDADDELRGNFIQIIRRDMFRKDLGKDKQSERVDDGRPNFKKFKKKHVVRKAPIQFKLASTAAQAAELGEPYWPTQVIKTGRGKTQASQFARQPQQDEDDEDMPLLPRGRRKLLGTTQQHAQDDEDHMPPPNGTSASSTRATQRGRSRVPESQPTSTQTPSTGSHQRRTRGTSVISEPESVASAATSTRSRRVTKKGLNPVAVVPEGVDETGKGEGEGEGDEDEGVNWGEAHSTSTSRATGTRSKSGRTATRNTTAGTGTATGTGTVTLDDDTPMPMIPSPRSRRAAAASGTSAGTSLGVGVSTRTGPTQSGVGTRRKLLPADDDEGIGFRGLGKKRRLL
ncbi:hypothetical protein I317_04010 [Kwoniella heveanensis CBS 569]|nr:hypothetical protein I317_04010 [Kwoniella heveanensis CBS 569]